MGKRGDNSSSKKPHKKKKKPVLSPGDNADLPADPPRAETTPAASSPGPSKGRHPVIAAMTEAGEQDDIEMTPFEQRLSKHYFMLSDNHIELRRQVVMLQERVSHLESSRAQLPEKKESPSENFEVTLLGSSNRLLSDIVNLWMLGMDLRGVLPITDQGWPPSFQSKLPYHYAFPLLCTEEEVAVPLRRALFFALNISESVERNEVFQRLFQQRRSKSTKKEGDELSAVEGLFQKYQRLRRQVKNDKIGKPVLHYVQEKSLLPLEAPSDWRVLAPESAEGTSPCFFFKVPGARKLFTDTFTATHAQVDKGRTVLSVVQLAILDQSVDTKAKSRKTKASEPTATATQNSTGGRAEQKPMAVTAAGSIDGIRKCATSIAQAILLNDTGHMNNENGTGEDGIMAQPCECCWVVDVQRPGSPVADMLKTFNRETGKEDTTGSQDDSQEEERVD